MYRYDDPNVPLGSVPFQSTEYHSLPAHGVFTATYAYGFARGPGMFLFFTRTNGFAGIAAGCWVNGPCDFRDNKNAPIGMASPAIVPTIALYAQVTESNYTQSFGPLPMVNETVHGFKLWPGFPGMYRLSNINNEEPFPRGTGCFIRAPITSYFAVVVEDLVGTGVNSVVLRPCVGINGTMKYDGSSLPNVTFYASLNRPASVWGVAALKKDDVVRWSIDASGTPFVIGVGFDEFQPNDVLVIPGDEAAPHGWTKAVIDETYASITKD